MARPEARIGRLHFGGLRVRLSFWTQVVFGLTLFTYEFWPGGSLPRDLTK